MTPDQFINLLRIKIQSLEECFDFQIVKECEQMILSVRTSNKFTEHQKDTVELFWFGLNEIMYAPHENESDE